MKKLWLLFIVFGFVACNSKKVENFEVNGVIKNANAKYVFLEEIPFTGAEPIIVDSSSIQADGSFQLKSSTNEEGLYSIRTAARMFPIAIIINDSKSITINADARNMDQPYTVNGSKASEALVEFDRNLNKKAMEVFQLSSYLDSISKKKLTDTTTNRKSRQIEQSLNDMKTYAVDFMNNSKSPALTLYALDSYQSMMNNLGTKGLNPTEVTEIINKAADKFPNSKSIAEAKKKLRPSVAPDFTLPDVNGKPVALSSFKGKYVLVDFWASWCQPCRKENPNVVKAFQQFKDRPNFAILGVSLDKKKEDWVKAIQDDGLTWTHVSDLQYWDSQVVNLYKFNSIPYNILVDPDGNIIAEDLHGADLTEKLASVLDKK
jgi:peroxiredoxin